MKRYKTVTAERREVAELTCDLCRQVFQTRFTDPDNSTIDRIQVVTLTGYESENCNVDGCWDDREETEIDCCWKCWSEIVLPWLRHKAPALAPVEPDTDDGEDGQHGH